MHSNQMYPNSHTKQEEEKASTVHDAFHDGEEFVNFWTQTWSNESPKTSAYLDETLFLSRTNWPSAKTKTNMSLRAWEHLRPFRGHRCREREKKLFRVNVNGSPVDTNA